MSSKSTEGAAFADRDFCDEFKNCGANATPLRICCDKSMGFIKFAIPSISQIPIAEMSLGIETQIHPKSHNIKKEGSLSEPSLVYLLTLGAA